MLGNVVVGILIAAGGPPGPWSDAMSRALTEALGPNVTIVVRESSAEADLERRHLAREIRADAVAFIAWSGADAARAVVRVHAVRSDRFIDRQINFQAADSWPERGRTVGFSIAAVVMAETEGKLEDQPQAGRGDESPPSSPASPPTVTTAPGIAGEAAGGRRRVSAGRLALDLAALGALGLAGPATGFGGAAHAEYRLGGSWHLRAGSSLRTGAVPGLVGDDLAASAGLGVAFRPLVPATNRSFGLGAVVEGLVLYHDLSHREADGQTLHGGRFLPGIFAGADGSWAVAGPIDLLVGLGVEVALGRTEVVVAGQSVATVPPLRLQGEAGFRVHF